MTTGNRTENQSRSQGIQPIRILPGIIIVAIQWLVFFIIPLFIPEVFAAGVFVGFAGGIAILVWWAFFSRAPKMERWGAILLMIAALVIASFFLDVSIATANMGMMFVIHSVPVMSLAFVVWAVTGRKLSKVSRRTSLVLTVLVAAGFWVLLRTDGMDGKGRHDYAWRWAKSHEDRLVAGQGDDIKTGPNAGNLNDEVKWPGFRGRNRDGVIHGLKIGTDWAGSPPVEIWRRPVGPGCSSFAVLGNLIYTQEQRGEYEIVSCYELATGKPVWKHSDRARFYDSHAGAGPRSTPTIDGRVVYTLGATGILNALDAGDGSVLWSRNAAEETGAEVLAWGFTGSPLVVGDVVVISLSGMLAAYRADDGSPLWTGPEGGNSYSSPHLASIEGYPQVLLMSNSGLISADPKDGSLLWEHEWAEQDMILQPAVLINGDMLIASAMKGARRLRVSKDNKSWEVRELWISEEGNFNFNDMVVLDGYFYGFDGPSMACFSLEDGRRMWKGERYQGWLLMLEEQSLMLVLSEKGELAMVPADPDKFSELARIKILDEKTWNHPALAGDILLVRNAQEMAAYKLIVDL